MILLPLLIVWQIAIVGLGIHHTRAQDRYARVHFDLTHCSAMVDYTRYCLPKDGCWLLDAHGGAACYRHVATLGPAE